MNAIGKRYVCGVCGTDMLVTRAGNGTLGCCGEPMALRTPGRSQPAASGDKEGNRG